MFCFCCDVFCLCSGLEHSSLHNSSDSVLPRSLLLLQFPLQQSLSQHLLLHLFLSLIQDTLHRLNIDQSLLLRQLK